MGKLFLKHLDGPRVYTCATCKCHLAVQDDMISSAFHGRHGKAYLMSKAVNTSRGPSEERNLITGLHVVCDIFCTNCKSYIGWAYEDAYSTDQRYKIGKVILEKARLRKETGWVRSSQHDEDEDMEEVVNPLQQAAVAAGGDDDDDDDDDEDEEEFEEEDEEDVQSF